MDDSMTEDILKRSKKRCEEFELFLNSNNNCNDSGDAIDSSSEYGIETFKQTTNSPLTQKDVKESKKTTNNENKENYVPKPTIFSKSTAFNSKNNENSLRNKFTFSNSSLAGELSSKALTNNSNAKVLSNKSTLDAISVNNTSTSNVVPKGTSVKALRNRWEEISRSENSPLPAVIQKNTPTTKFVSPATTIDQAFAFIGQNHGYESSSPSKGLSCDEADKVEVSDEFKFFKINLSSSGKKPAPPPPLEKLVLEAPPVPPHAGSNSFNQYYANKINESIDLNYRPITPNTTVLSSLMDDINNDLEKYCNNSLNTKNNTTDGSNQELVHTISFYRRQARNRRSEIAPADLPIPKMQIEASTSDSLNFSYSSTDVPSNDATLKRLHEQMIIQQDQICQASRALSYCRQTEHFRGSREEIDAQRALLIATERRRAYCNERDRVINARQGITESDASEPRGTLTFSYISVQLSRDFINMYIHQPSGNRKYYFIVLIKSREHVLHTSVLDSDQGIKSSFVEFKHYIQLAGLTADFVCIVEVYGLKASSHGTLNEKSKKKSIKKIVGNSFSSSTDSFSIILEFIKRLVYKTLIFICVSMGPKGGPVSIIDTGFQKLGYVKLDRSCLGHERFLMNEVLYPLDGNIILKTHCFAENTKLLEFCGFLSFYQILGNFGSWTRYWCVLKTGQMYFWRYPEDEKKKDPAVTLDLSKCLTIVTEVPNSVASFPHSIQVDVAYVTDNNPAEEIRMLFAADTREEMDAWIEAMNRAIRCTSIWNRQSVPATSVSGSFSSTSSSGVSSFITKNRFL